MNPSMSSFEKKDYLGSASTLCVGCGHDQITNHIITACFSLGLDPYQVIKVSGIGCSSKTPAYFLGKSFGINSMHGRMAPVATGSIACRSDLIHIGISGDGDTASIGLGGFVHLIRRDAPMVYIIANNGVYGLTKGQFSATSEMGAHLKTGEINIFQNIDICSLSLELGCNFVARSFSGDAKQLVPLLKAAFKHRGTAVIDIISPCVTFNNHDGSTKSFQFVKEHDVILQELGFIAPQEDIKIESTPGEVQKIKFADGSELSLKNINDQQYDVTDRLAAINKLHIARTEGHILTGLFYVSESNQSMVEKLNLPSKPLAEFSENELRGDKNTFELISKAFR